MDMTYMLTTVDNPYNPYDNFLRWFEYDELHGYHCCEKIGALAKINDGMSSDEVSEANELAIDTVILNDFTGLYRKVNEKTAKELVESRIKNGNPFNQSDYEESY